MSSGPLHGVRVLEVGGIGPAPFAGMTLAEMGADVIRIDRPGGGPPFPIPPELDLFNRGKRSVALDLKHADGLEALLALVESSDIVIEGHRPGVAERLGFGPDDVLARRPQAVYGRVTGWGQEGPLAQTAGHDVNYAAITGAIHAIGSRDGRPEIPLNIVGDFAGGANYLVMGVLAALFDAQRRGHGQVIDAAIVDGVSHLLTGTHTFLNSGMWTDGRGQNLLDGAAPFYSIFETSDGKHLAAGPIEPAFWAQFLDGLELDPDAFSDRWDPSEWPRLREEIAGVFARRTQAEWTETFDGSDACVSPVVSLLDAPDHPHIRARGSVVRHENGSVSSAPAPRFSNRSRTELTPATPIGEHTKEVLQQTNLDVAALLAEGAAFQA
ncbi:CaiB/BaiF CoA transferase family protein [Dietzia maris]|uniref:CaiB/BaiF CoA transferase family protein n=1 Tax=Dietzia maris TaxID=37915 RepID=UPI0037CA3088